ncbi:DNA-directed RNA polymerase subunit beta [Candidatus Dojkabacteria bacterium]|nr:DNA-directed RNA polymerase subunit beta [Candidatus Dojkabacteria bacterium]
MVNKTVDRVNLVTKEFTTLSPNLLEAQFGSFDLLIKEGIEEIFNEINPITDYTGESWVLEFGDIEWGKISLSFRDAQKLGLSFDRPLYIETKLTNKKTGEVKKQKLFVADIPVMGERGTFVVNGNERVIVMQIVRSEGVLFVRTGTGKDLEPLFIVKLMPLRGRWFDFEMNKHGVLSVKLIDKRPRILLTTLVRALGYSSDEDLKRILLDKEASEKEVEFFEKTLSKDTSKSTEEALLDIYRKLRPEDSINLENAKAFVEGLFFDKRRFYLGRVGRYKLNKKLGTKREIRPENYVLYKDDIVAVVKALLKLNAGEKREDDIDHLANRRIRGVGELIGERIRAGVLKMEKNIKDRMSTYGSEELITPSVLINTRPIIAAINSFFGSSAVSRYMDQENILSEIETKRRITAGGPRGLTKERATFSVRDVHSSHYSRLCPVTTPEGPSIGIVSHMSVYARINDYGFLEAPYYKVISKILVSEKDAVAEVVGRKFSQQILDKSGKVLAKKGEVITKGLISKIEKTDGEIVVEPYIDASNPVYLDPDEEMKYRIGPALLDRDKEGKLLDETAFVRFGGSYTKVPVTEIDYIDINPGQIAGLGLSLIPFSANDDPTRSLMGSNMQRQAVPLVFPKAPVVGTGFEKTVAEASGRLIQADDEGEVEYADAEKVVVKYKNIKPARKEYEVEKFVRTNQNTCFSQRCVVTTGDKVKQGDILIDGPSMDNGELALGRNVLAAYMFFDGYNYEDAIIVSERLVREDLLTSVHIKEYIQDIRETELGNEQITRDIPNVGEYALRNLDKEGLVRVGASVQSQDILVGIIAPKGETELTAEEKLLRAVFGEYARDVRDNSLRLPHGDKGVVIGVQVLDKEKRDKLNPGVLKQVKVWVARTHKISVGDKLTGLHGDKGVISKILPEEDMPHLEDGTPVDIVISPIFIRRMNLGQLKETKVAALANELGIRVIVPPFAPVDIDKLEKMVKEAGIDYTEKKTLIDGRTGEKFDQQVLVGPRYYLKLNHLADNKIHGRSTGSYTMVTQQPLGGKAQFGGQRFGEMEVWALEAHAVPNVLHEMLTIKSDDVVGRAAAYKAIIQGQPIEAPHVPESFKVLLSELRALLLDLQMVEPDVDEIDENEIVEGVPDEEIGSQSTPEEAEKELVDNESFEIKGGADEAIEEETSEEAPEE